MIDYDKLLEDVEKRRKAEIREDLSQWGLWSKNDGTGALSSTNSSMWIGTQRAANDDIPLVITDEYAEQIDAIMLSLKKSRSDLFEVAELVFINALSSNEASRRFNSLRYKGKNKDICSRTVRRKVNDIVDFVYERL